MPDTKQCPRCKEVLSTDEFKLFSNGKRESWCRTCKTEYNKGYVRKDYEAHKARMREYYWKNPEYWNEKRKEHTTGAPVGSYEFLFKEQNGQCYICNVTQGDKTGRRLAIDHDHASGEIRGLLCTNCNQGVGSFAHNPYLMISAAEAMINKRRYTISELKNLVEKSSELIKNEDDLPF
jgi:hypothetical protein